MAGAALALYGVWFALAFGLRTLIQVRRSGDSGWRGGSFGGRPGSAEWWAGVLFAVAIAVGVAAPVAGLLGLDPLVELGDVGQAVAVGVAAAGIALTLLAQMAMGDSWRIGVDAGERTDLVTRGPFGLVRNPIFSAMLVTAVGLTAMVPNVIAAVGLAALVAALELQVRGCEEPYLLASHGHAYADYAGRVGRFVPAVGRLSPRR
jgi:protein-S-isoprenylcysteine O-methyltransferase Ste14